MAMAMLALVGPAGRAQAPPGTDDFGREIVAQAAATRPRPGMLLAPTRHVPLLGGRTGDDALGTLSPGVAVRVLAVRGGRLRVRLEGWEPEPGARPVYARFGVRILSLILTPEAAGQVHARPAGHDAATGTEWQAVRVTGWLDAAGLVVAGNQLWQAVEGLNNTYCGGCHSVKLPASLPANRWAGSLTSGRHRSMLDEERTALLLRWLQLGASDAGN